MKRFLRRSRSWLLLAACLGGLGAYLAYNLQRQHASIEVLEFERLAKQSKVIEDNLTRQLVAIDLALQAVITELSYWASEPGGQAAAIRHLKSMEASMPSVRTFLVLDAKGTVIVSNLAELMGRSVYQRDYFQAPLQSLNPRTLYVSPPFKSLLNNYLISLSRVVLGPHGEFTGVVSAAIDPVDMNILLNSVLYADDMRAMLVHGDGKVFVIEPQDAAVLGRDLSDPASFISRHLKSGRPAGHFAGISYATGDERLAVLRTVQPAALAMDKPLVIAVSRETHALYAPWQRDARNQLLAYLLLVALSTLGLLYYQRSQARQGLTEDRLKLATEAAGVGIWEFDLKTRRYHWDSTMFAMIGLARQGVNERNDDWHQLLLPGELDRIKAQTRIVIESRQPFDLTFKLLRPDGELRFMRNRATLHCDDQGVPSRLIGTTEDVTERKLREADLRIAAASFECQESIVVTDANQVILRVNHAFTELFGYTAQDVIGATPQVLRSGRHGPAFYTAMWGCIHRDGAWQGEIWDGRKNGEHFPVWLSITAVCAEDGGVTHYVATHTDITLRKAAEEEIQQLAFYDALTGLPNRRLLEDRLHQAMSQAKRERSRLALLFLDLDMFKPVNDAFGHQAGDELLQAVAQRLQACVRESDTVARLGGDEFVLLLPSIEAAQDTLAVAEKIHQAFKQRFDLTGGHSVRISFSTGIAVYPEHGSEEKELTRHADEAMYEAKAAGRDRYVLFGEAAVRAPLPPPADSGGAVPTLA